jgi:hypothetical protein
MVLEPTRIALLRAEPNDSALSSGVPLLDDYFRAAYEPVATFHTILRPRIADPAALTGGVHRSGVARCIRSPTAAA